MPMAPAASCAKQKSTRAKSPQVRPDQSGFPRANGFNGFLRALPGDRALLPPSSADFRRFDAGIEASGPHDFTVRDRQRSSAMPSRPSHPAPNVRDDREAPLIEGCGTGQNVALFWGCDQCRADAADWHDGQITCLRQRFVKGLSSFWGARSANPESRDSGLVLSARGPGSNSW